MKISRKDVYDFVAELLSQKENQKVIQKYFPQLDSQLDDLNEGECFFEMHEAYTNYYLADFIKTLIGIKVEVFGEPDTLFNCPCCGLRTLSELYDLGLGTGYDICGFCRWEDDGTSDQNKPSSVNRGSISDYLNRIKDNPNQFFDRKWLK